VLELYLRAWNTQEKIAEELGIPRTTVESMLKRFDENGQMSEFGKEFKPYLYNIWTLQKQDHETDLCFDSFLPYGQLSEVNKDPRSHFKNVQNVRMRGQFHLKRRTTFYAPRMNSGIQVARFPYYRFIIVLLENAGRRY